MRVLEFLAAGRSVLRALASDPLDFAVENGVRVHEVAQAVALHSLEFMRTFSLETPAHWFGHFAIEGETQQMVGVCSLKGPPVGGVVEIAYYTFPGFEGRGIGTEMARFVLERARKLPGVTEVRTADGASVDVYADRGGPLIGPTVNTAQAAGIELRDVHIAEPSLETLFLHHTGRSLRD